MLKKFMKITVDGRSYNIATCLRTRSKDLLIFLHGLGCSKENFRHVWNRAEFEDLSLLSFDFLGFGQSDKPKHFNYKMEDQSKICNKIIQSFPDFDWHIIAHSMGGAVGLLLSTEVVDRIHSFVNLEGNLISRDCFTSRKAIQISFETFIDEFLPELKDRTRDNKAQLDDLERSSPEAYYKSCKSLVYWSDNGKLLDKFKSMMCRKAYFYGDRNAEIEPLKLLGDIPQVEIEQSGHMMMLDNPDSFYSKLKDFL